MQTDDIVPGKIIKHTKFGDTELVTVEVELHRFVLAQVNTHRTFSRNYQSSRAMPILKQLEQIKNNPAMPLHYGTAKKGMVAGEPLSGESLEKAKEIILSIRDFSIKGVEQLQELGLSKETANRYLEPWMYTKGIITATKKHWEWFFKLRSYPDAQKEIRVVSDCIRDALRTSKPEMVGIGEWHLPYVDLKDGKYMVNGIVVSKAQAIRTSTAACAQISYRTLDLTEDKINNIYEMLKLPKGGVVPKEAPHYSAAEHQAMASTPRSLTWSGNFYTPDYKQYRKMLESGIEQEFIN